MINCYVFFADPLMVGKVSTLATKISSDIKVTKVLDAKQLNTEEIIKKHFIITDYEAYQKLDMEDVSEDLFDEILIIDEVEGERDGNITYINNKNITKEITNVINKYIKTEFKQDNYIPVPTEDFIPSVDYPVDVYVKLGEAKFLKILSQESSFSADGLQKYKQKNVQHFYVEEKSYDLIMSSIQESKQINSDPDPVVSEINAVESIHTYILELGFDSKVIEMTKTLHGSIEEKFNHKFMRKLLERFRKMKGTFLYNHSYLTSVIALTVGAKFSWMNYDNKEKIYLGSMLHDLGYKHKENALRESMGVNEVKALSPEEQEDILGHTIRFARHLAEIDNVHQDVIKIVQNHHGVHGDEAYPQVIYPSDTNLIFALFILSHELALELYAINFNADKVNEVIEEVCNKFDKGNYKKIIPDFKEMMQNTFQKEAA